jgi:hypothetical protein
MSTIGLILLIILILLLVGALPTWPHAASWGNAPVSVVTVLIVVVIVPLLTGRL